MRVNKFSSARVSKVKIEYYKEPLSELKYVMSFCNHHGFEEWINKRQNADKVVTQMLVRYDYSE